MGIATQEKWPYCQSPQVSALFLNSPLHTPAPSAPVCKALLEKFHPSTFTPLPASLLCSSSGPARHRASSAGSRGRRGSAARGARQGARQEGKGRRGKADPSSSLTMRSVSIHAHIMHHHTHQHLGKKSSVKHRHFGFLPEALHKDQTINQTGKKKKIEKENEKTQATHSRRYWPPTCILMFSQSPRGSCSNHRCLSLRMAHPPLRERVPHPTRWSWEGAASVLLCPVPHRSAVLTLAALGVSLPTQSPSGA